MTRGPIFPIEEYESRWTRLNEAIRRRGYDTAVVWQRSGGSYDRAGDVFWLSNYATTGGGQDAVWLGGTLGGAFAALVFHAGEEPVLHICEPLHIVDLDQVATARVVSHDNLPAGVAASLVELGVEGSVLHNGDDFVPWQFGRVLEKGAPDISWVQCDDLVWEVHRIKSSREIDHLRSAGEVASRGLTGLMEALRMGLPESEAAARAASEIVRAGGGFERIHVAHGSLSERVLTTFPMHGYSTEAPAPGDIVRGWVMGPILGGDWLDPGRTAVCGPPTPEQRTLIDSAVGVVESLVAAIRPGVSSLEVGRLGDRLMKRARHEDDNAWYSGSSYGHGLGKDYFMKPIIPALGLTDDLADTYEVGMAFTVEVFLHHEGIGLAGIERTGIVTPDGVELLDSTPVTWW